MSSSLLRHRKIPPRANSPGKDQIIDMQKTYTLKGFVFMNFIGLIVRCRPLRIIKDAGQARKYSLDGMHPELEKLKKVELEGGGMVTCEVIKKQRTLSTAR